MRWLALVAAVVVVACGVPRKPGVVTNQIAYWQVIDSGVSFENCSDEPMFRGDFKPAVIGSALMYRGETGSKATLMNCATLDTRSCVVSDAGVIFDVAGPELTFAVSAKASIPRTACSLQDDQTWTVTDRGQTMTSEFVEALALVDSPTDCPRVEADLRSRSPNDAGVQGCVVTSSFVGTWLESF